MSFMICRDKFGGEMSKGDEQIVKLKRYLTTIPERNPDHVVLSYHSLLIKKNELMNLITENGHCESEELLNYYTHLGVESYKPRPDGAPTGTETVCFGTKRVNKILKFNRLADRDLMLNDSIKRKLEAHTILKQRWPSGRKFGDNGAECAQFLFLCHDVVYGRFVIIVIDNLTSTISYYSPYYYSEKQVTRGTVEQKLGPDVDDIISTMIRCRNFISDYDHNIVNPCPDFKHNMPTNNAFVYMMWVIKMRLQQGSRPSSDKSLTLMRFSMGLSLVHRNFRFTFRTKSRSQRRRNLKSVSAIVKYHPRAIAKHHPNM